MSYSYLSGLENGRHSITLTNLQRLAAYFGVDLVFFLQKSKSGPKYLNSPETPVFEKEHFFMAFTWPGRRFAARRQPL